MLYLNQSERGTCMITDNNWEVWLRNTIANIPSNVALGDAIKVEEKLREIVKLIRTTGL